MKIFDFKIKRVYEMMDEKHGYFVTINQYSILGIIVKKEQCSDVSIFSIKQRKMLYLSKYGLKGYFDYCKKISFQTTDLFLKLTKEDIENIPVNKNCMGAMSMIGGPYPQ